RSAVVVHRRAQFPRGTFEGGKPRGVGWGGGATAQERPLTTARDCFPAATVGAWGPLRAAATAAGPPPPLSPRPKCAVPLGGGVAWGVAGLKVATPMRWAGLCGGYASASPWLPAVVGSVSIVTVEPTTFLTIAFSAPLTRRSDFVVVFTPVAVVNVKVVAPVA